MLWGNAALALTDHAAAVPVSSDHLVDNDPRHVDVRETREAVLEHVVAQAGIPAAHHKDVVVLANILRDPILQSGVALGGDMKTERRRCYSHDLRGKFRLVGGDVSGLCTASRHTATLAPPRNLQYGTAVALCGVGWR